MQVSAHNTPIRTAFSVRLREVNAEIVLGLDNGTKLSSPVPRTSTLTVQDGQPLPAPLSAPD